MLGRVVKGGILLGSAACDRECASRTIMLVWTYPALKVVGVSDGQGRLAPRNWATRTINSAGCGTRCTRCMPLR